MNTIKVKTHVLQFAAIQDKKTYQESVRQQNKGSSIFSIYSFLFYLNRIRIETLLCKSGVDFSCLDRAKDTEHSNSVTARRLAGIS